jgi:hypothetical protein
MAWVFVEHETDAVLVAQIRSFATHRLTDEITAGAGDVQHGRMKLHEFHVAQLSAGAIGGGHAVAGRHGRIRRLAVDHARAAGSEDDLLGPDEQFAVLLAMHRCADTGSLVRQQINGKCAIP